MRSCIQNSQQYDVYTSCVVCLHTNKCENLKHEWFAVGSQLFNNWYKGILHFFRPWCSLFLPLMVMFEIFSLPWIVFVYHARRPAVTKPEALLKKNPNFASPCRFLYSHVYLYVKLSTSHLPTFSLNLMGIFGCIVVALKVLRVSTRLSANDVSIRDSLNIRKAMRSCCCFHR